MFNFTEYTVEIKDKAFTTEEGIQYPSTAYITLRNKEIRKSIILKYGYIETEDIYKKIAQKEPLNLNQCYVHNFSLKKYRKNNSIEADAPISIFGFSAHNAFFDAIDEIDFSYAHFDDGDLNFSHSYFARGKVNFHACHFGNGEKNFTYMIFKDGDLDFSNAQLNDGQVDFKNTLFSDGKKDFQYTEFGKGTKSFINTEFNDGDVSFINTHFHDGDVNFKVSRFGEGKVDFHFAKFGTGNISFERAEFGDGGVDFRTVEFNKGRVNFNRSLFGDGDIDFEASELKSGRFNFKRAQIGQGYMSFVLAEFSNAEIYFDNTHFGEGHISFYDSHFHHISFKHCHIDHYLDLRVSKCNYIDLSNTIARDIIDLKPYEFKVDVNTINFDGMRLIGRVYIDWQNNNVRRIIRNQKDTNDKSKAEQFRTLKENFNICGQYADEDKSYIEFKRWEAKHQLHHDLKKLPFSGLWKYPKFLAQWLLFDQVGHYATNPVRVLRSIVIIYAFFTLIYISIPFLSGHYIFTNYNFIDKGAYIADCMYFSGVTFFTIGYGDFTPIGIFRALAVIEGFVGVFMMSYFTVAFVRKILR